MDFSPMNSSSHLISWCNLPASTSCGEELGSLTTPREEPPPFVPIPTTCLLHPMLTSAVITHSHFAFSMLLLNFTNFCCITLSASSLFRQELLYPSDPLCCLPLNLLPHHYIPLRWGNQQHMIQRTWARHSLYSETMGFFFIVFHPFKNNP